MKDTWPDPQELGGALQGTILYLSLYLIVFIQFQSYSKFYLLKKKEEARAKDGNDKKVSFKAIKYYNSRDGLALTGDRTVGNFVEFAIVFLPLLWLHALFVNPTLSFTICAVYTAARSIYPILFYAAGFPGILLSTVPGYAVILYLMLQLSACAFLE